VPAGPHLGSKPLALRVGAASGKLLLGSMGSPLKLEYTVIGTVVNQAARLEGAGSPGQFCVPAQRLSPVGDAVLEATVVEQRSLHLKGREAARDVVTLAPERR
jgi:adenylate cyclase